MLLSKIQNGILRAMHSARLSKALALVLGMLVCGISFAQNAREVPPFELEHLTFNPSQRASMLTQTGDLLPAKQLRASLTLHYENNPLILSQIGGPNRAVVRNRFTAHLNAAFGITRWLEVGLQFPVVFQKGDTVPELGKTASVALGTTTLQARVGFLSEERHQPLDLSFQLGVGLPWGNSAAYTRNASVSASRHDGLWNL